MPDFSPDFIGHSEVIGDSSSSEYNLSFPQSANSAEHNRSTNIVSKTIMHVLEFLLMIGLLPFTACQRVYENDHLMVMLRVILEVTLELIMWLVLAGVSILTSAALIFDDLYSGKSGSDDYRRLVKNCTDESSRRNDFQPPLNPRNDLSVENEWPEEIIVPSSHTSPESLSSPFPKDEVLLPQKKSSRAASYASEKDDESVNFSFYKPLRYGSIVESEGKKKK